ncbi:glycoside hydrolase family 47 protein [Collybia nuda]|uniref:alpha-1,2-Mannosidase n=1 Tax=Collybia nuda TaxID=64659 RepID=A0A9P6CPM7_9AGAR|nr:glycoside hydrolase family 47 protein [Collybia nuda]
MVSLRSLSVGVFLSFPLVFGGVVQKPGLALPNEYQANRDAVVKIFTTSYQAYKDHAFGHDNLQPISQGFSDGRNGWGATIIDAMTTMHIMGLNDLFVEAVDFASKIDFSKSKTADTVSVFETTIRYLGGLLSAYELSDRKYPSLLSKAKQVADKMAFAWTGTNAVPYGHIDFSTNTPSRTTSNIAEAGTLILEWATLSKYVGNDTYGQLAEKSMRQIISQRTPLPGLPAQGIDPSTGQPVGGYTWGGGSDSYFEYLIKHARLSNSDDEIFADTWRTAVDSSIKNLLKRSTTGNYAYLADYDSSGTIRHVGSHLACFHGGNWLFGGRLLNNQTIINIGLDLVDACWNTYASTATRIGPEVFAYTSSDGSFTGGTPPTPEQIAFNQKHGFYITAADYIFRPEVLESNFYAWRVTGDHKYLERAASAIDSFNKYLNFKDAFAGLEDVDNVNSQKIDDMESFWFAEVLKYLYLTFDNPAHISLDDYVFNTEAHPFKLPTPKANYGSSGEVTQSQSHAPFKASEGPLPAVSSIPAMHKPLKAGDILKRKRRLHHH